MSLIDVIRPAKEKILVAFLIPVILLAVMLIINPAYQRMLLLNEPVTLAIGIVLGILAGTLLYYPMACGLVYIFGLLYMPEKAEKKHAKPRAKIRKKPHKRKELAFAIALIAVFNPLTISLISSGLIYVNNYVINRPCGLEIVGFGDPSPAEEAGMKAWEVIKTIDGSAVDTIQSLSGILSSKIPGDTVYVVTDMGQYNVTLGQDPDVQAVKPILGVMLKEVYCSR